MEGMKKTMTNFSKERELRSKPGVSGI